MGNSSDQASTEPGTLTFTTTLIGDTVRIGDADYLVTQKYQTERRLFVLRDGNSLVRAKSIGEFEYNNSRPTLVRPTAD